MHIKSGNAGYIAGTCFAMVWAVALFGILEADFWTVKLAIGSALASASLGMDRFLT